LPKRYLIVGAGFSGAVVAEQLCRVKGNKILVIDERPQIGGNCFTVRDTETNVMVHQYGPHIFHTDNIVIWKYINRFCEMVPYINRVKAVYNGEVFSLPVNLHTINQFFRKNLNPSEAEEFINSLGDRSISNPGNFEEQALKMIGKGLYKAFFYLYTKKQWGCEPSELPASILKRLPVRFDYNDNYYTDPMQGIPRDGYTPVFEKMLSHSQIEVQLNTKFDDSYPVDSFDHIIYTGPIDAFFNFEFGQLGYRTVFFEKGYADGDYQGNAVINYTDDSVPYTRIFEPRHLPPWENHRKTIFIKEYSRETEENEIGFYPKRLSRDLEILACYQARAAVLNKFTFLGRLATYRYMDMHQVIADALRISKELIEKSG
jgi:UDP-galactopyranose mutase